MEEEQREQGSDSIGLSRASFFLELICWPGRKWRKRDPWEDCSKDSATQRWHNLDQQQEDLSAVSGLAWLFIFVFLRLDVVCVRKFILLVKYLEQKSQNIFWISNLIYFDRNTHVPAHQKQCLLGCLSIALEFLQEISGSDGPKENASFCGGASHLIKWPITSSKTAVTNHLQKNSLFFHVLPLVLQAYRSHQASKGQITSGTAWDSGLPKRPRSPLSPTCSQAW